MVFIPRAIRDRVDGLWVCFGDRKGVFTDAVMSVKTTQPYCRLVFEALKPCFFTDAVAL